MEAFRIKVIQTENLNFHNHSYYEKGELSVSVSGRLVHQTNCALLESFELAEHYKNAIHARHLKNGDKFFEAEIEKIASPSTTFSKQVSDDSKVIREKLEKWKYPNPNAVKITENGWVIRLQIEDDEKTYYLCKIGEPQIKLSNSRDAAKVYKKQHFVQKALEKLNKNPKFRAIAVEVKN